MLYQLIKKDKNTGYTTVIWSHCRHIKGWKFTGIKQSNPIIQKGTC